MLTCKHFLLYFRLFRRVRIKLLGIVLLVHIKPPVFICMNDTWKYILQMKVRVDRIYSFAVRYCVSKYKIWYCFYKIELLIIDFDLVRLSNNKENALCSSRPRCSSSMAPLLMRPVWKSIQKTGCTKTAQVFVERLPTLST